MDIIFCFSHIVTFKGLKFWDEIEIIFVQKKIRTAHYRHYVIFRQVALARGYDTYKKSEEQF